MKRKKKSDTYNACAHMQCIADIGEQTEQQGDRFAGVQARGSWSKLRESPGLVGENALGLSAMHT